MQAHRKPPTKKRKSTSEPTIEGPTPEDAVQKLAKADGDERPAPPKADVDERPAPPKADGDERPAPPEAKFGCVKPEDRPNFAPLQKNHVTNMGFSVQCDKVSLMVSEVIGVGPVPVPFEVPDHDMSHIKKYDYTGFTRPMLITGEGEHRTGGQLIVDAQINRRTEYGGYDHADISVVRRCPAVPYGKGEAILGNWWLKGVFSLGKAIGQCTLGNFDDNWQYVGPMNAGKFEGRVEGYNGAGELELFRTYANGIREGPADELNMGGQRIRAVGSYVKGKKSGQWEITDADGKHYTTHFDNDVELVQMRTKPIYLPPLPSPPELDADGNPKIYTVEEAVKLANADLSKQSFGPQAKEKKPRNPHERRLMNALSREVQAAGWIVDIEHPAGRGFLDMKHKATEDFLVLSEGKWKASHLPQASGQLSAYHTFLLDNDEEVKKADEAERLILCDILAGKPDAYDLKSATKWGQQVWWPDKGNYPEFIKEIIADKKKPAVAA